MLKINLEYNKGILFVRVCGNLNRRTSYKLSNYLVPVIMKHGIKYLVYNLYELDKIDEIGLKSLMYGKLAINANKGEVYMCEVPTNLKEKLKTTKIKKAKDELKAIELVGI